MRDDEKTREDLIAELAQLRLKLAEHEAAESACKDVEKALEDQIHFLQNLIDTIPNPIFYKDTQGRFLGCNKAFQKRMGLKKDEIIGKTSFDLFPREYAEHYHKMDQLSFRHPGEQVYETTILYADGKPYDVVIYKGTFTNADGTLAGLVGVTVDITERKQAEEALRKAHDELERRVMERTAALAKANLELRSEIAERKKAEEALRESSEKLKLFAYSVAHDLKSPTVAIHGLTRLLCKQVRAGNAGETHKISLFCEQILKASENVVALVEKINTYASTRESPIHVETISLKEILRMVREEFSAKLSLRQVDWVEPAILPDIKADRLAMLRVFRNLVDNALKYGGDELSKIVIAYEEADQFHILSVSDNGVGVRSEDSEKIFGLFQRNAGRAIEGVGLGLAIVKDIAEQHGGKVWVEPGTEGGSTFKISISKNL